MKHITDYLQQLDFSKPEATLYLILLKSGPMTIAKLAQAANINRTVTYGHVNSLLNKGIIAKTQGAESKITANPPEHLHQLVQQKANTLKTLESNLPTIINTLTSLSPQEKNDPSEIKYYKGRMGAKTIYEECLKAKELRSYVNIEEILKIFPENAQLFDNAIKRNPTMKMFEFVEDSPQAKERFKNFNTKPWYRYKFLPNDVQLLANDILIYEGKVAIINIGDQTNITGVILQNQDYYNNSKQLFDLLWRMLPEPTK